ncbi:hypothetical protein N0V90_009355 [Kalmusia sp. IMI 367209]|nr:hypothetical protein N0V90_009355 [Kalmusia sp. IMI 367209]
MEEVCATCTGLQKHLKHPDRNPDTASGAVRWVDTDLSRLRLSSGSCRACALLLQGILLHHSRFASVREDDISIIAKSFHSGRPEKAQDHLSVELRWEECQDDCCEEDDHEHHEGYPDLKLEFFTDEVTTLKAHKKMIAWDTLPRTFQEAALFTKSLGVRFLWIDSLCIVQDDASDKLKASQELGGIFGNALLTLAATSAVDPSKGLFAPTTPPFKIQATDSKGSLSRVYVREQPSHFNFKAPFSASSMDEWELPFNTSNEANARTPLFRRAWAYSERLLSSRVLYFTDSEMILECQETYQCECERIVNANYDQRTTYTLKQEFAGVVAKGRSRDEDKSSNNGDKRIDSLVTQVAATTLTGGLGTMVAKRTDVLQLWSNIVTEYTARSLTQDTDRLLAISEIANCLSKAMHSGYIAGQWTSSTLGLLWYPNEGTHCRRPMHDPGRNVPSWSWASIEGSPIFFDNESAMDLACSVSFPANSSQVHIPLPIGGDTLELRAAMAAEVTFREDAENEYSLVRNNVSVEFEPDVIPLRGEDSVVQGATLVCVLISMSYRSSILGLVLKKLRSDKPLYRRIGRFECYECSKDGSVEDSEEAEALFDLWFPEIDDMTKIDERPRLTFAVI